MSKHSISMTFLDQSPPFAYGFECGRFYEMMANGHKFHSQVFNIKNEQQIRMMCTKYHYTCNIRTDENWPSYGWLTAELDPSKAN
jgi:hypothetical protein